MAATDIDAYIAKAQPFARPILQAIRAALLNSAPDLEQTLKWGMPTFTYKGKILCNMAAFTRHATFGFWYGELVTGGTGTRMQAMGDLGRIVSVDELPDAVDFAGWVAKAKQLIDDGVKPPHVEGRGKHAKPEIEMVPAFQVALDADETAKATWDGFPPSCRREYLEWIVSAKRDETREKRIATTIAQLAEGKRMNWRYEKC
jgi:hypothetical protein